MRQCLLLFLAVLSQPGRAASITFPLTITFDGRLTCADYERHIEHAFDVPAGTRCIDIAVTFTGADRQMVIDLGLRDPEGLRGWSGGRRTHVSVSRLSATPGYLPGPVLEGRWAILLALGTPATVVWARELSEDAIVEGLKAGRVYLRTRGPTVQHWPLTRR